MAVRILQRLINITDVSLPKIAATQLYVVALQFGTKAVQACCRMIPFEINWNADPVPGFLLDINV